MEVWRPWLCGSVKTWPVKLDDVTLISAKDFSTGNTEMELPSNLKIVKTIEPSWEGQTARRSTLSHVQGFIGKRVRRWKWNSVG